MYRPAHFTATDPAELQRIIQAYPLGVLVHAAGGALDANHIPFEFAPEPGPHGILTGHVARANPVWQEAASGSAVLVVFRGVDGYISPNWYPSKFETHRLVPTWNYEAVHAHGIITIRDDEKFLRGVVARLTRRHEARQAQPWKMGDAPPDYIDSMLKAIVGIEIAITHLEGKAKLSQNREPRDRAGAIDALRQHGNAPLADAMAQAHDKLP